MRYYRRFLALSFLPALLFGVLDPLTGHHMVNFLRWRVLPQDALFEGAFRQDPALMQRALGWGADINGNGNLPDKRTALHIAAFQKRDQSVAFLIAHGANPNLPDLNGLTALDLARKQHYPQVVRLLEPVTAK
jgi:hypothetical protein